MKRCLIYARVSTKQRTTKNQLPPLRKFAKDRGWEVVKEMIDHGYSGTTATRPQLTEVMSLARRRDFDVLLVYALDRFAPQASSQIQTIRRQKEEWMRQTVFQAAKGHTKEALQTLDEHGKVNVYTSPAAASVVIPTLLYIWRPWPKFVQRTQST